MQCFLYRKKTPYVGKRENVLHCVIAQQCCIQSCLHLSQYMQAQFPNSAGKETFEHISNLNLTSP